MSDDDRSISSMPEGLWSEPAVEVPDLGDAEPIRRVMVPASLTYRFTPGTATTRFLTALREKRLMGERCPSTGKVYVPARGMSPIVGLPTTEQVELGHTGTVSTFCIVNIDFTGGKMQVPFVSALVVPDGADIPVYGIVSGVPADEVRMGQRVRAVWVDDDQLSTSFENIDYWEPIDEPDVDVDELLARL